MKNIHQKRKELKCAKCNYATTENLKIEMHLRYFHKESLSLECEKCPYKANNVNVMTKHALTHEWGTHTCRLCDFKASKEDDLTKHMDSIHRSKTEAKFEGSNATNPDTAATNKSEESEPSLQHFFEKHGLGPKKRGRPKKGHEKPKEGPEKELKCAYCSFKTKEKKQLLEHINALHDKNQGKKTAPERTGVQN